MADQFLTPGWYLQPGSWPYWAANGLATFAAPQNDAWSQNPSASDSKGGILGILARPTASLDRSKLSLGGILGALGASAESQASDIPYWLQTAMPFSAAVEAPRPSSDPPPQVASPPAWNSPALSNVPVLPSADFDSSTPYWLRTALPSGVNSEMFGVPQAPAGQPANPAPQLSPAAARNVATPPIPPALLPSFFSVPPNESNLALRQTPAGSNTEVPAPPELDSVFARDLPARGLNATTLDYGRPLDDTLNNNRQPERSAAPDGAENLAFSDMWLVGVLCQPAVDEWSDRDRKRPASRLRRTSGQRLEGGCAICAEWPVSAESAECTQSAERYAAPSSPTQSPAQNTRRMDLGTGVRTGQPSV